MLSSHPQGRALAQGTLRKEKQNQSRAAVPHSKFEKPLPSVPVLSQPYNVQKRIASSTHGQALHRPNLIDLQVSASLPSLDHPTFLKESIRTRNGSPSQSDAIAKVAIGVTDYNPSQKLGNAYLDDLTSSTPLVIQAPTLLRSAASRKPVPVTLPVTTMGMGCQTCESIDPAALAGRAAFLQNITPAFRSKAKISRPQLSIKTCSSEVDTSRLLQRIFVRETQPSQEETFPGFPSRHVQPTKHYNLHKPSDLDHAKEIISKLKGDDFQRAKDDTSVASKIKAQIVAPRADFRGIAYEENQVPQAITSRPVSRASRGSPTPLSAISDFFHKCMDKATALAEKVESIESSIQQRRRGSRSGSFSSAHSFFSSFGKDEAMKREERKQKLKASISYPKPESCVSSLAASSCLERDLVNEPKARPTKSSEPRPRIVMLDKNESNRNTTFGDFISINSKQHPYPAPPLHKSGLMGHISKTSFSSRRGSADSDATFHCQGIAVAEMEVATAQQSQPVSNLCRSCCKVSLEPPGLCYSCKGLALDHTSNTPECITLSSPTTSSTPMHSRQASNFNRPQVLLPTNHFSEMGNPYACTIAGENTFESWHSQGRKFSTYSVHDEERRVRHLPQGRSCVEKVRTSRNTRFYNFYDHILASPR